MCERQTDRQRARRRGGGDGEERREKRVGGKEEGEGEKTICIKDTLRGKKGKVREQKMMGGVRDATSDGMVQEDRHGF